MSTEIHLENWQKIKETALKACPVKIGAFALVAVGKNGEIHWGGNFGEGATEWQLKQVEHWLAVMKSDCADVRKRLTK